MSIKLHVTGLEKSFEPNRPVFAEFNVDVGPGELIVVRGHSGSGKSTLIRCLAGQYRPTTGTVRLTADDNASVNIATAPARTVAWLQRRIVVSASAPMVAPPRQSAARSIARAARVDESVAQSGLRRMDAEHLAGTPLGRLRGKERTLISLVAALSSTTPLLLLDEPEKVLDEARVADWIQEHRERGAAVLVTSSLNDTWAGHRQARLEVAK